MRPTLDDICDAVEAVDEEFSTDGKRSKRVISNKRYSDTMSSGSAVESADFAPSAMDADASVKPSKRSRKGQEDHKVVLRREKNKLAARRCRAKKMQQIFETEQELKTMRETTMLLTQQVESLQTALNEQSKRFNNLRTTLLRCGVPTTIIEEAMNTGVVAKAATVAPSNSAAAQPPVPPPAPALMQEPQPPSPSASNHPASPSGLATSAANAVFGSWLQKPQAPTLFTAPVTTGAPEPRPEKKLLSRLGDAVPFKVEGVNAVVNAHSNMTADVKTSAVPPMAPSPGDLRSRSAFAAHALSQPLFQSKPASASFEDSAHKLHTTQNTKPAASAPVNTTGTSNVSAQNVFARLPSFGLCSLPSLDPSPSLAIAELAAGLPAGASKPAAAPFSAPELSVAPLSIPPTVKKESIASTRFSPFASVAKNGQPMLSAAPSLDPASDIPELNILGSLASLPSFGSQFANSLQLTNSFGLPL